MNCSTNRYINS